MGMGILGYLWFIIKKMECLCGILGIILVMYSFKKGKIYEK